jgi:hypothetical protein
MKTNDLSIKLLGLITAIQVIIFKVKYGKEEKPNRKSSGFLKQKNLNSSRCFTKNAGIGQEQSTESSDQNNKEYIGHDFLEA